MRPRRVRLDQKLLVVMMTRFLADTAGTDKYNREGLVSWASDRFHMELKLEELKNKSRQEIADVLAECSRRLTGQCPNNNMVGETNFRGVHFFPRKLVFKIWCGLNQFSESTESYNCREIL